MLFICTELDYSFYIQNINVLTKSTGAILHTIGRMITELSHLKKKGSKRGRDSDPSNEDCRENCIPKQPRKFFCRDLSRYLTKTQHSAPCSYRGSALKNAKCPAIRRPNTEGLDTFDGFITQIKSLSSFHHYSDGLSSNKTPFLRGYCE